MPITEAGIQQSTWHQRARWPTAQPRSVVPVLCNRPVHTRYNFDKAMVLHRCTIEAQGKRYDRTWNHIRPIHLNILVYATHHQWQTKPHTLSITPSHIPKPKPHLHLVCQSKKYIPTPTKCPPSHISILQLPQPANASPTVDSLLHHLSTLNSLSPSLSVPMQLELSSGTQPAPPTCHTWEVHSTSSPHSTSTESAPTSDPSSKSSDSSSAASPTSTRALRSRLPITYNGTALSQIDDRLQFRTLPNVFIPLPAGSKEESPTDSDSDHTEKESTTT